MAEQWILVVDDDVTNRAVLQRLLEREGYAVRTAAGGVEALDAVAESLPSLILLDVMMADVDGFEVCRRLRERPETSAVPVVMVTALSDQESRVEGLRAGADDFVTKPFDASELTARVRSLLRLCHYQSLARERELLENAVRQLADGLVVTDPTWRVVVINDRARHLLGIAEQDANGAALDEHLARFEVVPPLGELVADRPAAAFEIRRVGDPPLIIEGRLSRTLDPDGRPTYYALVLRDVTQERGLAVYRSDFLSLTAHKIRTPMAILRGLLDLLAIVDSPEARVELLTEMAPQLVIKIDEIEHILSLLLRREVACDLSARPAAARTAIADALTAAAVDVQQRMPTPALELTMRNLDRHVAVAPGDLEWMFRELLLNALKFGRTDPVRVEVEVRDAAEGLDVRITDNGQGIPHEYFGRVFDECFQLDRGFTGQVPGMGMGLSIVQRVVRAYGGDVDIVASTLGEGTTFRLRLPKE